MLIYNVEHMEEDEETTKSIPRWVELEYMVIASRYSNVNNDTNICFYYLQHMRSFAGPRATVHFTHLSPASCSTLSSLFSQDPEPSRADAFAHQKSVIQLMEEKGIPLEKVCLLDPKAEKELAPEDGDGRFEWFLFGVGHLPTSACFVCDVNDSACTLREFWVRPSPLLESNCAHEGSLGIIQR